VAEATAGTRGWRTDLAAYRAVLGSRMQSQRSYRISFTVDLAGSLLVGVVELAEVWVLFRAVDRIITNFHLPRSTLIMLVAAFAGYELTMRAYEEAVLSGYRFYSYGDAMAII